MKISTKINTAIDTANDAFPYSIFSILEIPINARLSDHITKNNPITGIQPKRSKGIIEYENAANIFFIFFAPKDKAASVINPPTIMYIIHANRYMTNTPDTNPIDFTNAV